RQADRPDVICRPAFAERAGEFPIFRPDGMTQSIPALGRSRLAPQSGLLPGEEGFVRPKRRKIEIRISKFETLTRLTFCRAAAANRITSLPRVVGRWRWRMGRAIECRRVGRRNPRLRPRKRRLSVRPGIGMGRRG